MKKRFVSGSILVVFATALSVSGCTGRSASYDSTESRSDPQTEGISEYAGEGTTEYESEEPAEYMSLIEKYVGEAGTAYKAYDTILKWDGHFDTINSMYPAEEWVDADGTLRLPFEPEDVMYDGSTSYASFYVPDELAVSASTGELADICLTYYNSPIGVILTPEPDSLDFEFEWWIAHSNSMEESLRRDDFAEEYFERYMAEDIPVRYEGMDENEYSKGFDLTCMLDIVEVILSQPEACEQLTEEQRADLVRRVIKKAKLDAERLFCYTTLIDYPVFFQSITEENLWYSTIMGMDWTEDEWEVIHKYLDSDAQE